MEPSPLPTPEEERRGAEKGGQAEGRRLRSRTSTPAENDGVQVGENMRPGGRGARRRPVRGVQRHRKESHRSRNGAASGWGLPRSIFRGSSSTAN